MQPEYPMATVRKDDLDVAAGLILRYVPDDALNNPDVRAAFGRLDDARHEDTGAAAEPEGDTRPDGIWGRVELPGWRNHTGWITDEVRFGEQMCVVRNWDGQVIAMVKLGPACQVLPLPTPLKRPGPVAAITAGGDDEDLDDGYDRDFDGPVL
jgi:hypothetical protein